MAAINITPPPSSNQSPYERRAYAYLDRGYCVIPIAPGTKRPGEWGQSGGWHGMKHWERFFDRLPTQLELDHWYGFPDAGIGLLCGGLSNIVALDRDYDTNGTDALDKLIPYTPVKKRGAKGYTAFFRYNGEKSTSFNIGGMRVLDVLSDGRQTLMPGTIHPEGHTYVYLTEDLLEDFNPEDLPVLPDDFLDQVAACLAPYQTDEDRKTMRKAPVKRDNTDPINTDRSHAAEYYADVNRCALEQLDAWVPKAISTAVRYGEGWRCIATWRGAQNPNVGVHPHGIFDFGGNYGMTPIDLVMNACGLDFGRAVDALVAVIKMPEVQKFDFLNQTTPAKAAPAAPSVLPWQRTVTQSAPAVVMLPPTTSLEPAQALPSFLTNPPGILGDIARWMTDTAPKQQPELSLAAAIALGSVVMGRTYRSQFGNFTSLYMIMVAKSTEGKEHPQACCQTALTAAGLESLIGGSGYTSASAVYSQLLKSPVHLVTVDEMGKLLKLSRAKGQSHTEAALDKMVEAFGRVDGVMQPQNYSDMTAKEKVKIPVVHNPAITLLGATTPGTFYEALTNDLVKDGFLGRCIVIESKQPRQLTRMVPRTKPSEKIVSWMKAVHVSGLAEAQGNLVAVQAPGMEPHTIELPFSDACTPLMTRFEEELNREKDKAEGDGLDVLLGRTLEKAMRLAMVACKAENPANREVKPEHMLWAISYVKHYDSELLESVKRERSESDTDAKINKLVKYVVNVKSFVGDKRFGPSCAAGYMPRGKLLKLMHMGKREFEELVSTALESKRIMSMTDPQGTMFHGEFYQATGE